MEFLAGGREPRDQHFEMRLETPPVWQAGQWIEIGKALEALLACPEVDFELLAGGDVEADRGIAVHLALRVEMRNDGRIDPVERAVLAAVADLAMPDPALGDRAVKRAEEVRVMQAGSQHAVIGTDKLRRRVAADLAELAVHIGDRALHVGHRHDGGAVQGIADEIFFRPKVRDGMQRRCHALQQARKVGRVPVRRQGGPLRENGHGKYG